MTAKLICAFVLATFPKFPACSHLLCLYSSVFVGPGRKPRLLFFSCEGSNGSSIENHTHFPRTDDHGQRMIAFSKELKFQNVRRLFKQNTYISDVNTFRALDFSVSGPATTTNY